LWRWKLTPKGVFYIRERKSMVLTGCIFASMWVVVGIFNLRNRADAYEVIIGILNILTAVWIYGALLGVGW
jgi:hypothetical protein